MRLTSLERHCILGLRGGRDHHTPGHTDVLPAVVEGPRDGHRELFSQSWSHSEGTGISHAQITAQA
jgi:hypothetical protein